jgi:hypothetical protein
MDNTTLIIILAIILLILIALNNITIITHPAQAQATCSQTTFGCCPDGINSKVNFYGTNCPSYMPYPGYPINPTPINPLPPGPPLPPPPGPVPPPPPGPGPTPPKPIGGCAGTQYGCCPDDTTPKINVQGSNCLIK